MEKKHMEIWGLYIFLILVDFFHQPCDVCWAWPRPSDGVGGNPRVISRGLPENPLWGKSLICRWFSQLFTSFYSGCPIATFHHQRVQYGPIFRGSLHPITGRNRDIWQRVIACKTMSQTLEIPRMFPNIIRFLLACDPFCWDGEATVIEW
jgi:hypothetical protein